MGGRIDRHEGQDNVEFVRRRQMQTYRFLRDMDQRLNAFYAGVQKTMSDVSAEEKQMLELLKKYRPTVVVSIDLPLASLTAHQRWTNKHVKGEAIRKYRETARLKAMSQKFPAIKGKVEITHVWFCGLTPLEKASRKNKAPIAKSKKLTRPEDEQNAIQPLKAAIDGLVDAGLIRGDKRYDVKWGDFVKLSTQDQHHGKNGILLFIREING